MPELPVIDATAFMAMHDANASKRENTVLLFSNHFKEGVELSIDQVGICDAVVWKKPRETQDLYYPFMDVLHSVMPIKRFAYTYDVIEAALKGGFFDSLSVTSACLAAYVLLNKKMLFTYNPALLNFSALNGYLGNFGSLSEHSDRLFSNELTGLYNKSLCLTVTTDEVCNAA